MRFEPTTSVTRMTRLRIDRTDKYIRLLIVLGLYDILFTLFYLSMGLATEANPIMAFYYDFHPVAFVIGKNLMFLGGIAILYSLKRTPNVERVIRFNLAVYMGLVAYHIIAFSVYGPDIIRESHRIFALN